MYALLVALTAVATAAEGETQITDTVRRQAELIVRAARQQTREPADLRHVTGEYSALERLLQPAKPVPDYVQ